MVEILCIGMATVNPLAVYQQQGIIFRQSVNRNASACKAVGQDGNAGFVFEYVGSTYSLGFFDVLSFNELHGEGGVAESAWGSGCRNYDGIGKRCLYVIETQYQVAGR
ncbi:hypothetical protein B9H02_08430 [Prosthecochloris sp. HL-130-GSB]|nr:hypothetical protein B9H02_08430 [Prosthecochloris sp. HL-130-GSB]